MHVALHLFDIILWYRNMRVNIADTRFNFDQFITSLSLRQALRYCKTSCIIILLTVNIC